MGGRTGTCFSCDGSKRDPIHKLGVWVYPETWAPEECAEFARTHEDTRTASARKQAERLAAKRDAEAAAVWAANHRRFPWLQEALDYSEDLPTFAQDILAKSKRYQITTAQGAALRKVLLESQGARATVQVDPGGWWGQVGEREDVDVEVLMCNEYPGEFAPRFLVLMRTTEGQLLKTWNSGALGAQAKRGDTGKVRGTVRAHEVRNGVRETSLTRVAVLSWSGVDA